MPVAIGADDSPEKLPVVTMYKIAKPKAIAQADAASATNGRSPFELPPEPPSAE